MSELSREKARELAGRVIREKTEIQDFDLIQVGDSSNNIFRLEEKYFVKVERYSDMRSMSYREPVILQEIDLRVDTPPMIDYGFIDGYLYRLFDYIEGKSLDVHSDGESFYDLSENEREDKLRAMGEKLALIHESKSFEGFGNITTIDGRIQGASADSWWEGLKDIQGFWHEMMEDEGFEGLLERLNIFYLENQNLLGNVNTSRLLHLEMDFRNILFQDDDLYIADWEAAAAGDPLLDLISLETIIFWLEQDKIDLEKRRFLREGYRSIRDIEVHGDLEKVYRVFELSRLFIIFKDNDERRERIKEEIEKII